MPNILLNAPFVWSNLISFNRRLTVPLISCVTYKLLIFNLLCLCLFGIVGIIIVPAYSFLMIK